MSREFLLVRLLCTHSAFRMYICCVYVHANLLPTRHNDLRLTHDRPPPLTPVAQTTPPPPLHSSIQDYNDGSAPFPYATECAAAAAAATCDPATLVAEMDFPGFAEPVALDITGAAGDGSVEPVRELAKYLAT